MTVVVSEKIGSRTLQRSALSSPTGKRVFDVYENDSTTGNPLTAMRALRTQGVPQLNDPHPEDRQMTVISFDITANTDSDYFQTITCNYAVTGLDGGGTYAAQSTNVRGVFVDTWRNNPIAPDVELAGVSGLDIGGTKIDQGGKPVSIALFQQTVDIRSPFSSRPPFDIIRQLTNTRNDSPWQGFPRGVLVYLGAAASVTNGNVWTTTHKFAADEIFHCRQIAFKEPDGKPKQVKGELPDNAPEGTTKPTHAEPVYWVQKFPHLRNFDALGLGQNP